jgi:DNA polymerase epsilon subunit 2
MFDVIFDREYFALKKYHSGIYTEGCFVLAEGNLIDGVFEVKALGFPPAEVESITR